MMVQPFHQVPSLNLNIFAPQQKGYLTIDRMGKQLQLTVMSTTMMKLLCHQC